MFVVIFAFQCLQRYCEHCFSRFIVTARRGNNIFTFYRRRAARKQYFCHFIVAVRRGNNIFAFYRHRAAREQYLCRFIVTARRGNNICAVLSSPCSAETIFLPFYRHRAAREQYFAVLSSPRSAGTIFLHFIVCSITASIKIFVFTFAERRCVFGMVGAVPVCPPERPRSGISIPKTHALCAGNG